MAVNTDFVHASIDVENETVDVNELIDILEGALADHKVNQKKWREENADL